MKIPHTNFFFQLLHDALNLEFGELVSDVSDAPMRRHDEVEDHCKANDNCHGNKNAVHHLVVAV